MNLPGRSPSGREAENLHYHTSQPHTINTVTNGSKSMEFDYDANGNMTEVVNNTGSTVTSTETLFWNESNQLQADHNLGGLHHFMYDSNGERYLKGTLLFNSVDVDGNPISGTDVSTSDYTVYVNPYMVYNSKYETNSGYSKHYYVGSERVASAIGTGDFKGNSDPQTGPSTESLTAHPIWSVLNDYLDDLEIEIGGYDGYESTEGEPLHSTYESCIETYGSDQDEIDNCLCLYFPSYAQSQSINCENYAPIYWYHPDYLGNTEFVSDRMGRPYQHFYYSPFGEELVEQEPYNADYNSPYHFNAKEVDPETGFHYYGARYYNSNLSVWLSVDPLADEFASWTPFHFVHDNPINLFDPTGMAAVEPGGPEGGPEEEIESGENNPETVPQNSNPNVPLPIDEGERFYSSTETPKTGAETVTIAPKKTDSYEGVQGFMYWVWTGGNENGGHYDTDGNYLSPSPNMGMPPNVVGGPLRKGQSAIKIGKFLFNPGYLHKTLKPQILKGAGDFARVVGRNPDIGLKGTQIILKGAKNGPYAGKTYETALNITDFIF